MERYTNEFGGGDPISLAALDTVYVSEAQFICPGSGNGPGSFSNVMTWMDYVYVNWPNDKDIPDDFPVMYDKRLANHRGTGLNVLFASGEIIFDTNAVRLRQFAKEHPQFNILLPEDIAQYGD